jgi:hypothetical protein
MAERERRVRWPDGASLSVPFPFGRFGGTYYWNPGSPSAPNLTFTRALGVPGIAANTVFLRKGMTSEDTLGPGLSGNVSTIFPSVTLNGTIPGDGGLIPKPWKSRVTSIEAGIGTPNAASVTSTFTPQQAADFLAKYVFGVRPAMGPDDELSPFARTLSSSNGSLGPPSKPAVKYVGAQGQNSLGDGMGNWQSSSRAGSSMSEAPMPSQEPGGLLGLLHDYLRDSAPGPR